MEKIIAEAVQVWQQRARKGAEFERKGEEFQWKAAAEYKAASEAGASQRQIADEIGKSQMHISYMIRALENHGFQPDLSFTECYALTKGHRKSPENEDEIDVSKIDVSKLSPEVRDKLMAAIIDANLKENRSPERKKREPGSPPDALEVFSDFVLRMSKVRAVVRMAPKNASLTDLAHKSAEHIRAFANELEGL